MADTEKKQRYKRGQNPNSRKNLKVFQPGQSGNPAGKPIGAIDFKTRFEKKLHAIAPDKVQQAKGIAEFCAGVKTGEITNADAIDAALLYKAIVERDMSAIRELLDRTEGKPTQAIEHTGKDGGPIETATRVIEPE